jgi:hypothetical protein
MEVGSDRGSQRVMVGGGGGGGSRRRGVEGLEGRKGRFGVGGGSRRGLQVEWGRERGRERELRGTEEAPTIYPDDVRGWE